MDAIYGLRTLGVDPHTGQRLYLDKDGNATFSANGVDQVHLGDKQPKLNGNASLYLTYKRFTFNCGFNIRFGGYALNETLLYRVENSSVGRNLDLRVLKDIWQKPGDETIFSTKDVTLGSYTYASDMFVHKNNIFSCSHINISYDLSPDLLTRLNLGVSSLSFSASLSDIFYLSTIKRERGTSYPYSINPNFAISCTF